MKKMANEFKEFIARGNVMDLAVGVIIGGAFSAIVTKNGAFVNKKTAQSAPFLQVPYKVR